MLGFVVYHLGYSIFVTAGEHRIVIHSYGMLVVIGVSRYCVGIARCISFCARAPLCTDYLQFGSDVFGSSRSLS